MVLSLIKMSNFQMKDHHDHYTILNCDPNKTNEWMKWRHNCRKLISVQEYKKTRQGYEFERIRNSKFACKCYNNDKRQPKNFLFY